MLRIEVYRIDFYMDAIPTATLLQGGVGPLSDLNLRSLIGEMRELAQIIFLEEILAHYSAHILHPHIGDVVLAEPTGASLPRHVHTVGEFTFSHVDSLELTTYVLG